MKSNVYFVELSSDEPASTINEKLRALFLEAGLNGCVDNHDVVAVKVHFGEKGNETFIKPSMIRPVVDEIKLCGGIPFLTDTNTLYRGQRDNAISHIKLAHEHGFTLENVGAPVIIADGLLGRNEVEVEINGKYHDTVSIAEEAATANAAIIISHATGHIACGYGGTIKNIGMGFSSRMGKLMQHSKTLPEIVKQRCNSCGVCIKWCPEEAILMEDDGAFIVSLECIHCGECLAVCRQEAVRFSWNRSSEDLQMRIAEHAYGVIKNKPGKVGYITFLISITKDCDCLNRKMTPILADIGVLAGKDPVAVDAAVLDLTKQNGGKDLASLSYPGIKPDVQLEHGEMIGMGTRSYNLIKLNGKF
ncbi:MAG: DUF362 domain-containing protein [Fidelibacterota bacterium]